MPVVPPATSSESPLRALRSQSGLSPQQIIERGREIAADFPATVEALYNIERRGTMKYSVLTGISHALGIPIETVRVAAEATRLSANKKFVSP